MSDYILVPGAGGDAWYWSRVAPLLRAAGHDVVAVGLPAADESAGLEAYADTILAAIGPRRDVVLVAQSMGAFSAPMAAVRGSVASLLLVVPMIPIPGESVDDWWSATGSGAAHKEAERAAGRDPDAPFDPVGVFFHDVPGEVQADAWSRGEPKQADRPCADPWPLDAWPDIPTRVVIGRHDRLFPYDFARALTVERLGIEPDVIDSGHLPALAKPEELTAWLRAAA
ncbi:MAG TPA: alpha/beta hydrolase [Baekduia sp.]|nr:alpha/beta hydrolase [Baekduia sp.]